MKKLLIPACVVLTALTLTACASKQTDTVAETPSLSIEAATAVTPEPSPTATPSPKSSYPAWDEIAPSPSPTPETTPEPSPEPTPETVKEIVIARPAEKQLEPGQTMSIEDIFAEDGYDPNAYTGPQGTVGEPEQLIGDGDTSDDIIGY